MARVYASMTGQEVLPDLSVLARPRARGPFPGVLEPAELGPRWDKVEKERPEDHGDVGIDAHGIFVRLHPDVILARMPGAARVIDRFRRGFRDLTEADEEGSVYALDLKLQMRAAASRADARGSKARAKAAAKGVKKDG